MKSADASSKKEALVREILERVADKWTLLVIDALLGKSEVRFSALRERIGGVSQKMLWRDPHRSPVGPSSERKAGNG